MIDAGEAPEVHEQVSATLPHDSATGQKYNEGGLLVARHILLLTQRQSGAPYTDQQIDSVHKARRRDPRDADPGELRAVAKNVSQDPGSAQNGGDCGLVRPRRDGPEFEVAHPA